MDHEKIVDDIILEMQVEMYGTSDRMNHLMDYGTWQDLKDRMMELIDRVTSQTN